MKKLIIRTAALALVGCMAFGCVNRFGAFVAQLQNQAVLVRSICRCALVGGQQFGMFRVWAQGKAPLVHHTTACKACIVSHVQLIAISACCISLRGQFGSQWQITF